MDDDHQNNMMMRKLRVEDFEGLDFRNKSALDVLVDVCGVSRKIFLAEGKRVVISQSSAEKKKKTTASTFNFKAHNKGLKLSVLPVVVKTQKGKQKYSKAGDHDDDQYYLAEKYEKDVAVINKNIAKERRHCNIGLEKLLIHNSSTPKRSRNPDSVSVANYQDDGGDKLLIHNSSTRKRSRNPDSVSVADQDDDGDIKKKKKTRRVVMNFAAANEQDLPERFRQRINELKGKDIRLVIQKTLYMTDLSCGHDRLSIPFSQIISWDFLTDDEKAWLKGGPKAKQTLEVPIIDPKLSNEDIKLTLAQWDMAKPSGKTSSCYVLRSKWKNLVKDNNLKQHQVMQVWSFRVQVKLHMALVVVQLGMPTSSSGAAASSSGSHGSGSSSVVTD